MIRIKQLVKSVGYALSGVKYVFQAEQNFRIQSIVGILVLCFGFYVKLTRRDWVVVVLMIALVLLLEILNTVMEKFLDILKPKMHYYVAVIKDLLALMVLFGSLIAAVIGLIVFYPYIVSLFAG